MRSRSRLTTAAALAVSTAALASPAMGARYQDLRSADAKDAARQATMHLHHPPGARTGSLSAQVPATAVESATAPSSFDWGSAAVGAGAMLGISAISLGGVVGLRRRRGPVAPSPLAH